MSKTYVLLEIDHAKPVPHLGEKSAQRVYVISGVDQCEVVGEYTDNPVKRGPTPGEVADAAKVMAGLTLTASWAL